MVWIALAAAILVYAAADLWLRWRRRRQVRVLLLVGAGTEDALEGVLRAAAALVGGVSGGRLVAVVERPAHPSPEWAAMLRALGRALPGVRLHAAPHGADLLVSGLAAAGGRVDVVLSFDGRQTLPAWLRDARRLLRATAKAREEGTGKRGRGAN
ncbi:MAG: hypothetical protein IMW98_01770 [Firmicutes bacterium]|nr:hypothetical protein [Bacillota bacterium]